MQLEDIKRIAIVGAGTMGAGIAQVAAIAGFKVQLFDINPKVAWLGLENIKKALNKGVEKQKLDNITVERALDNITIINKLDSIEAELVIEAILERLDIKVELFRELETLLGKEAILASNTSSIPITQIAAALDHPGRCVGMHFFNPAHIMKLVEIISGEDTDSEVAKLTFDLAEKMGKKAVNVKDSPGFVVNRVARHFYIESLKILEEGVAQHEDIDTLMEGFGFKMGPFRLMDLIGIDTNLSVTKSMFEAFNYDPKFRPSRIQQQKTDAGHWGRKKGKGFYDYS